MLDNVWNREYNILDRKKISFEQVSQFKITGGEKPCQASVTPRLAGSAAVLVLHPPVRGRGVLAAAAVAGPCAVQLLLRHELDHGGEVAVQVVHLVTAGVTKVGTLVEFLNFDINTEMNAMNYNEAFMQVAWLQIKLGHMSFVQ